MKKRVDFPLPESFTISRCRGCKAAIVWIESPKDRPDGSTRYVPLHWDSREKNLLGEERLESHFAHCPERESFRRR